MMKSQPQGNNTEIKRNKIVSTLIERENIKKGNVNTMRIINEDINALYGIKSTQACPFIGYIHENSKEINENLLRRCIIVCPGGAYVFTSDREAEPVALEFFNRDYNVFVLRYNVFPKKYPTQLVELACAVDYIRKNHQTLGVLENKIFCMGFSAGGHLCGNIANATTVPFESPLDFRPNGVVLGYPVISSEAGYVQSHQVLTGKIKYSKEEFGFLDLDTSVTKTNPPAFIWTTATDSLVPALNSMLYAIAYAKNKIKYELHVFKEGEHGLALADERTAANPEQIVPSVKEWQNMADDFLKSL